MSYLIYVYLRIALFCGFYRHVCRLTNKWGVMNMQSYLFFKGYPHCPSCYWPVEHQDDHLQDKNSWCYEQSLPQCPNCKMPLCPEDNGCRYCASEKDIEEELQRAIEMDKLHKEMQQREQEQEEKLRADWEAHCREQEEAERQKELDRQRDAWQDRMDALMDEDESCDGSQYYTPYRKSSAGIFSTDNPQSDAMQIKAEQHCGNPNCRYCN